MVPPLAEREFNHLRCEDCEDKTAHWGLQGESASRWCAGCAKAHPGAANMKKGKTSGCEGQQCAAASRRKEASVGRYPIVTLEKQLLNMIGTWYKVVEMCCEVTIGYNPRRASGCRRRASGAGAARVRQTGPCSWHARSIRLARGGRPMRGRRRRNDDDVDNDHDGGKIATSVCLCASFSRKRIPASTFAIYIGSF